MTDLALHTSSGTSAEDSYVADQVKEVVDTLEVMFAPRDKVYRRIDDVLEGRVKIEVPRAFRQAVGAGVHSPMPAHIKNTVVAALSVNAPAVNVPPLGFGDSWEENASKREHFFDASWRRQEKEAGRPIFRLFMDALVSKGEGVLKTVEVTKRAWSGYQTLSKKVLDELQNEEWRRKGYADRRRAYDQRTEEYKRRARYPIATTDVLPETFRYFRGEDGYTVFCEVKQVPYLEALRRFGMGLDAHGRVCPAAFGLPLPEWHRVMDKGTTLTMIELWTWKRCVYLLLGPGQTTSRGLGAGTLVKDFEHGYGDPVTKTLRGPYFHALGTLSHNRAPEYAGTGILTPFLDMFVLQDNLLTMRLGNAYMTAWASWKRNRPADGGLPDGGYGDDGTASAAKPPVVITPGTVIDEDIGPVEMPKAGQDFNLFSDAVTAMLELALPSVLQGAVDTTESGWQLAQAVHLARLAWDPIVDNAERALSDRCGFESWLIEHKIGETVYVRGEVSKDGKKRTASGELSIGPDDLGGAHDVYDVKLDPELPSTEVTKLRYWGEAVDRGFASKADAITDLGRNPDEVERQIRLEKFKESDVVQERILQRVLEKLGQADQDALVGTPADPALAAPAPGAALAGMGQVTTPGLGGQPLEPTPQGPMAATAPMNPPQPPGNPPGTPPNLPTQYLVPT